MTQAAIQNGFSELLRQKRQEAGFRTAYRFFYGNGGEKFFGFSYRQYLRIELGKSVPGPERLSRLVSGLRLRDRTTPANELALSWLKTFVGEDVYANVFSFLGIPASARAVPPTQRELKNALTGPKRYLTPEQLGAALTDKDTYLCFLALGADTGTWSADKLIKELGIPRPAAERALQTLFSAKLLKRAGKGRYRSAVADQMVELPRREAVEEHLLQKHREFTQELIAAGREEFARSGIIRADDVIFRDLFPTLQLSLEAMLAHKVREHTDNSALYYVTGRVVKLRNF
jgi:hypothetical protein